MYQPRNLSTPLFGFCLLTLSFATLGAAPGKSADAAANAASSVSPHNPVTTDGSAGNEPPPRIAMGCNPAGARWALGKEVTDALLAKAQSDASARSVRVLHPGVPVTMEYNGARLDLQLNPHGKIVGVNCG